MEIPVILKVLGSLTLIIVLSKWIRHLHIPVLAGTLFLGFACGQGFGDMGRISFGSAVSAGNISMLGVVLAVVWLSTQMSEAGLMKELVVWARKRVPQRAAMALLPALIGLLPMPGGALFSAPMVDDCDHAGNISALLKTKINYWFRHIWEYWWPLYPGVLLAIEITGLDTAKFMLAMFPLSLFSVFTGWFFMLRRVEKIPDRVAEIREKSKNPVPLFMPVALIVSVYVLIKLFIPQLAEYNKYLPMLLGVVGAILAVQFHSPLSASVWRRIIFSKRVWSLTLLVLLVRVYGAFMEADLPDGTALVTRFRGELEDFRIPIVLVLVLVPFVCGLTTGIAIGFVGASFPVVMGVVGPDPSTSRLIQAVVIAYASGYLGMLLSPVHVCLIVTNQHFTTRLSGSIWRLAVPAAAMFLLVSVYCILLGLLCS